MYIGTGAIDRKMKFYALLLMVFLSCQAQPDAAKQETETLYDYDVEEKLNALDIKLEVPGVPKANFVHAVRTGNLIFLAGKGPSLKGKLGKDLSLEQGYDAAREVGIRQLGVLKAEIGDLNKVKRVVKVLGMVNATPEFTEHSQVINGFSDLMVATFGARGKHARAAVGMGSLPSNIACEIELIVEVQD